MADVVYVLGAGFNCSVVDASRGMQAPLARNFFQVLLQSSRYRDGLDAFRGRLFVDVLLEEIERYWRLDLDGLATKPFDIEECLTLFESQLADGLSAERDLRLRRAAYALRNLLLSYLGDVSHSGYTPTARKFGSDVLASSADVLSFNFDTLAEEAIASASGIGPKPQPTREGSTVPWERDISDEDLDASHLTWRSALACSFMFDELDLPVAGVPPQISGERFYAHTSNALYDRTRVLKLHGSIDWLKYTSLRVIPPDIEGQPPPRPAGIVLERHPGYWLGESPSRNGWRMESVVIPPQLYKEFGQAPFPQVWAEALKTRSECRTLIVVGYSFPPTDFRTRRLFLEAFSGGNRLSQLVVVNPDTAVVGLVRRLTSHEGPVISSDSLPSLYGLPSSWFDFA